MPLPTSVTVSPSSATDANSGATSGGGSQSFYFGGNPTAAALAGAGGSTWKIAAWLAAGALLLYVLLRR